MKRVLLTGIGGDIAQGVATIIRECRPAVHLLGADLHQQHGGSLFVDELFTLPPARAANYLDALDDLIARESVDVAIPMTEPELAIIAERGARSSGVEWVFCGAQVVKEGIDKLATARALERLGIAVPWTVPVSDAPREYPCILKSRTGSGSRAVFIVNDAEDATYLVRRHPDAVFQELLTPPEQEVTCAVYRTRDDRVAVLQMLRRLAGGFTSWAQVVDDAETSAMCTAIARGLDLRGSMNVQLRVTARGPRVFEINPRFSSTTLMRHRLGFTDVVWALDEADGMPVEFSPIRVGEVMVRVQGAAVLQPGAGSR